MADDVTLPPTGSPVVATDDVGGKHYQRIKVDLGGDGAGSPLVRGGQSRANSLPAGLSTEDQALLQELIDEITGTVAEGDDDDSVPASIGGVAVAHGANPTAFAAGKKVRAKYNRAGILFVVGGHPNVITKDWTILDSDGALTNAALVTASAGTKIVVTEISAICAAANTGNVNVRIGFGTASVPAASLAGTAGILLKGQFAAGGGNQKGNGGGIIGIGADDEDLRITCDDPAGGALEVHATYYTIES